MDKTRVIVYGLGAMWYRMRKTILEKYEVVGYVDKGLSMSDNLRFFLLKQLKDVDYDLLFVMPAGKIDIIKELVKEGIPIDKIVPYYGENTRFSIPDYKISANLKENRVEVQDEKIKLYLYTKSDDMVFREVFICGEYDIRLQNDFCVVDIGMNIGLTSIFFSENKYINKIYAFEPFVKTYKMGCENVSRCKNAKKIEAFNYGLSESNMFLQVNYNQDDSESMSIIRTNEGRRDTVVIKDVAEILRRIVVNEQKFKRKILCKMDCEGSEYGIMRKLQSEELIKKIDIFLIEWHWNESDEIENCLIDNGYTVIKTYDQYMMGKIKAWK